MLILVTTFLSDSEPGNSTRKEDLDLSLEPPLPRAKGKSCSSGSMADMPPGLSKPKSSGDEEGSHDWYWQKRVAEGYWRASSSLVQLLFSTFSVPLFFLSRGGFRAVPLLLGASHVLFLTCS